VLYRLAVMAAVFVALLVPITMIWTLVYERTARRDETVRLISEEWGRPQQFAGPVLVVPFRTFIERPNAPKEIVEDRATFLPEQLQIDATVTPEIRRRGLFGVPVYRSAIRLSGRFAPPRITRVSADTAEIRGEDAQLAVALSDPRGIAGPVQLTWAGTPHAMRGGLPDQTLGSAGISVRVPVRPEIDALLPFTMVLEINGTKSIRIVPIADETSITMRSPWKHPGFQGSPLPYRHEIGADGFTAEWRVPQFGHGFPSVWRSTRKSDGLAQALVDAEVGVTLIQPVDIYQRASRAMKYAALFIVMTFVVAFLWEIIGSVLIHPIQYLFIGFALCVFYLLVLALSEHVGFDWAYVASSLATIGLITWYWQWVIHARGRAIWMLATLSTLYGFLYLLLRAEDMALLAGAVGLFVMLALVMFLTRKVDWFNLRLGEGGA
jgi:inner membrane protein